MEHPYLTIIIPAHNEESRLPKSLQGVFSFLEQQDYTAEVLVVENGSRDRTFKIGKELSRQYPNLQVIHIDQRGKGLAIRSGMLAARGQYRLIADADFSMPVEEINRLLPPACDSDISIASRETAGAFRHNEPPYRHLTGRIFNLMIRLLVLPGLKDTQCGFKCFREEVARDIFQYQTLLGWAFDVEVLVIARLHGWKITEVPINWYYFQGSKVNVLRDSLRMFSDLLLIRSNTRRGMYARKE